MAYTLADYSRLAQKPLIKGVVDIFRMESKVLDNLRITTTGRLTNEAVRTKTMPDVYWRKIGAAYTESKGTTESMTEKIALLGGLIDVPKELVTAKDQIVDQRAFQTKMFLTAASRAFDDKFFNGNPLNDEDELVGIWYRLTHDMDSGQTVAAASATGLDVSPDTSTTSWASLFTEKINELIHACDGHACDVLYMNDTCYLRLMAALRASGMLDTTQDNYGRKFATFGAGGPKIIDIGFKADQSTRIMPNTETFAGALTGGAQTSIYAVKYGEDYVQGWDLAPLDATDIGLLESGVAYRTIVDWGMGIHFENPRSLARLRGIIAA